MRVVIVGAGAAVLTLASNMRKNDKESEIKIFTKSEDIAYSPCAIEGKKEIVFISNRPIGIESANELAKKGYNVTFLEQSFGILPLFLDHNMSSKLVELNEGFSNKLTFRPVVNTVVSKVGDYNYACSDITESFANMIEMPVVSACIETCQKARYNPQNNKLHIKMICKPDSTIVGCQMLFKGDLSSRIDAPSFIIKDNMKCEEIIQKEFSHTPSLAM